MHGTGGKQREEGLGPSGQVHRAQAEELPARQPWRRRRPASPWALHIHVRLQKPPKPRRLPGHGRRGDAGPALGGSSPEPHTGAGGQLGPTPIHGSFVGSSMSPSREVSSHFPRSSRLRCQAEPWACNSVNIHQVCSQFSKYFPSIDRGRPGAGATEGSVFSVPEGTAAPGLHRCKCPFRGAGACHGDRRRPQAEADG